MFLCPKENILILSTSRLNTITEVLFRELVPSLNLIIRTHQEPGWHII